MTSRPATQCYVYIHLPGATTAVVAGRFTLNPDRRGGQVGEFVYGQTYLERKEAVPFDPVELMTLSNRPYETAMLKGVFGALRDAGPDHWGRRLIERRIFESKKEDKKKDDKKDDDTTEAKKSPSRR